MDLESTQFYRTIQSGYSELMGMYPNDDLILTENHLVSIQEKEDQTKVNAVLPFKVRNADAISDELLDRPVPQGFIPVPLHAPKGAPAPQSLTNCKNIDHQVYNNKPLGNIFQTSLRLVDTLRVTLTKVFKLSKKEGKDINFQSLSHMVDIVYASMFEGIAFDQEFSWEEMRAIYETLKWDVLKTYMVDPNWHALTMSFMLRKPMRIIDQIVFDSMNCPMCEHKPHHPKFHLLSAHDTQVAGLWQMIDPQGFHQDNMEGELVDWYGVPYASYI